MSTSADILSDPKVVAAAIAAAGAVLAVLLKALGWLISGPRERRRALYVDALEHVLDWKEMPHRLRRRSAGGPADEELRERFHLLQEQIERDRGRIGTESGLLARSYCRLVHEIKTATQPYIERARDAPPGGPLQATAADDRPPCTDAAQWRFLFDVRLHLSLWPVLPRLLLAWRNRTPFDSDRAASRPHPSSTADPSCAPDDTTTREAA
jgi:hypothetical protein